MVLWSNALSKELHKPKKKKFKRRQVISLTVDHIWATDLVDLRKYAKVNKNYVFLLMVIDVFSKYAWVVPIKNKTGIVVAKALEQIFKSNGKVPSKLWADNGKEYYNSVVKNLLTSYGIELYSTFNEEKSCIVERFNRTFLHWLFIYFDTHRNTVYLPILKDLVTRYNNTRHRSIGCTPVEARKKKNYQKVFDHLYSKRTKTPAKPVFHIGDQVRLSIIKKTFEKGYSRNWTEELFVIDGVRNTQPITYTVKDLAGEKIKGTFYAEQLQKSEQTLFQVEKIIGKPRIRNGIKEVRVQWKGYNKSFNRWIPQTDVIVSN